MSEVVWSFNSIFLFLALAIQATGQTRPTPSHEDLSARPTISRGTLVVALASPNFIVIATDSRKTYLDGRHEDNSKKLFAIGKHRVLAIAGLAAASVPEVPGLAEEISPLLDDWIEYSASSTSAAGMVDIDDRYWNGPPPSDLPPSWPEESKQKLRALEDMPHYIWWQMIGGPEESIANIAATYRPSQPLEPYRLEGLLAGFKNNGEAKLEHMVMIPAWDTTPWGLPRVALGQMWDRLRTRDELIHKTMGITKWADWVLQGEINDELKSLVKGYPAVERFVARRANRTVNQITETEALNLCKELIHLTSTETSNVGAEPMQTAVIRPSKDAVVEQPKFPRILVPLKFGTTRAGSGFTPDFPFGGERDTTYAWCEIENNVIPIPLGGNYFYGNKFDHATFVYRGGAVYFGTNNRVTDSTLIIDKGTDESALSIDFLRLFQKVIRRPASNLMLPPHK